MVEYTTINIKPDTWRDLNKLKEPGDSFDDVIQRLLGDGENNPHNSAVGDLDELAEHDLTDEELDAVRAMAAFVRDRGEASPKDIRDEVHEDHPANKGVEWWWKELGGALEDVDGIERVSQRRFVWKK